MNNKPSTKTKTNKREKKQQGISQKLKDFFFSSSLKRSLLWVALAFITGLSEVWIVYFSQAPELGFEEILEWSITKGVFLVFSIVLISALTLDHFLFEEDPHSQSKFVTRFLFSVFPAILLVICAILFIRCHEYESKSLVHGHQYAQKCEQILKCHNCEAPGELTEANKLYNFIAFWEKIILIITVIYAVVIKFLAYPNRSTQTNQPHTTEK